MFAQPAATVQITGGYSLPLGDYKGTFGDTRDKFLFGGNPDSNTYFMKSGFNYGIGVKIPINRKRFPINITGSLSINSFSQAIEYSENNNYVEITLSQNITSFTCGLEYTPVGKKKTFNPYFGAEFTMNLFAGSYLEDYIDSTESFTLENTIRGGVQFNAGVDIVLHNNIGITLAAKYAFANLFGKSYVPDLKRTYYLNDKEYTLEGITYPSRNITFLQIVGGVSFYFGR